MSWFRQKAQLKEGREHEPVERPEIVLINVYHDTARSFTRLGAKDDEMIFEHHRQEAIEAARDAGLFVRYDPRTDRWYVDE